MKKFAAYAHNLDAINLVMGVEDKRSISLLQRDDTSYETFNTS